MKISRSILLYSVTSKIIQTSLQNNGTSLAMLNLPAITQAKTNIKTLLFAPTQRTLVTEILISIPVILDSN